MKHILILSDGREISSGMQAENAIASVSLTQCVNAETELTAGSVCAGMLEITIFTPGGGLNIAAGEELTLYQEPEDGQRSKVGIYIAEKPVMANPDVMKLTAFDRVIRLDKDLSAWLAGLNAWPYTLQELANMVCAQCGVTLETQDLPNADLYVQKFSADGITGRDLLRWVGQAVGRFCVASEEGTLRFDWYKENPLTIGEDLWYYQNGLKFEDFSVEKIAKVQLRQNAEDIGISYPDATGNTYVIEGNPLLAATDAQALLPVAQNLYEQLKDVTYTPARVTIPESKDIRAGDILSVTNGNGKHFSIYVMTKKSASGRDTLECTGSAQRESTFVLNNQTLRQYMGKVMNLAMTVDGMKLENADMAGNLAQLQLDLGGIAGKVETNTGNAENLQKDVAQLKLESESFQLEFQSIRQSGVDKVTTSTGYRFDAEGLKIQKDGEQMENRLDNQGMVVSRNGEPILAATATGVEATDVRVNNFLHVGNCRFEDYTNGKDSRRTACFFTG